MREHSTLDKDFYLWLCHKLTWISPTNLKLSACQVLQMGNGSVYTWFERKIVLQTEHDMGPLLINPGVLSIFWKKKKWVSDEKAVPTNHCSILTLWKIMFYKSFTILENCLHEQMEKITFLFPHQSCTLKKYVAWNSKIDSRSKFQKGITSN